MGDEQFLDAINFGDLARHDLARRFIDEPLGHHFLNDAASLANAMRDRFPECVQSTIKQADATCRHEFRLLGRDASFGNTIDWFWIPDTDARWPIAHIDDLPPRFYNDADRPGDVKYPWELNRHQYFVTLAKAHLYTGDLKYIQELQFQVSDWLERNPFRVGINWYSSLEVAIRLISWTNTIALIRSATEPRTELMEMLLRGAYQHAHYLQRTLTTHWLVANNHLVGETAGLFAFAATFPEFHASAAWRRRAVQLLTDALDQQIFSDGVNREQATGYHRFVLDFVVLVDRLAALNGIALPDRLTAHLKAMFAYEAAIAADGGLAPSIGDCDDGRGMMLSETAEVLDYRGWLPYGAVRFNEARLAAPADAGNEESAWLMGTEGWREFDSLNPKAPAFESAAFTDGGHYVLRTGKNDDAASVFVRCGPFGLGGEGSSVHSHADLLAPVIRWRRRDLAIDSGTYGYLCDAAERDELRTGSAHNTCLPNGLDQGVMQTLWNWSAVPNGEVLSWSATEDQTELRGRVISPTGFQHERTLTLQRAPLTLSIEDVLSYTNGLRAVWRLHLAPGLDVEQLDAGSLRIYDADDFAVSVVFAGFSGVEIGNAGYAPRYGERQQIRCVELTSDENPARGRVVLHDPADAPPDPRKG